MSVDVRLPDLGEGIESGGILKVLVAEGDEVRKDQGLVEIETDKATVEVPAPQAGRVERVQVKIGQNVRVGEVLMSLAAPGARGASPDRPAATPERASEPPAVERRASSPATPPATPSTHADGLERESSAPRRPAASGEPPARPRPTVPTAAKSEPHVAPSRDRTEMPREPAATPASTRQVRADHAPSTPRSSGPIPAGPAVRRFAREVGVDLAAVRGSGPGGRITRDDILEVVRHASRSLKDIGTPTDPEPHLPGQPSFDDHGAIRVEIASKIRRTIATRMFESWSTVPRVTNFDDADITELEKVRQASKGDYLANGIKLTTMPFIVKATSMALKKHPLINAVYNNATEEIIYKRYVNIGMAVDSPRGLVVPVLRNTDQLSIAEIARLVAATADRVRNNNFGLEDLRGGTFTISNLGAVGGTYSTPIVNIPEVAILLTGKARKMPVVVDDKVVVRLMLPLSISYDHRLVDGATAARFLNEIIGYLQAPGRLLLAP